MKSTFRHPGGSVVVEPSPTLGSVLVWVNTEGGPTRAVTIPLHLAGVVSQAIAATAEHVEAACQGVAS